MADTGELVRAPEGPQVLVRNGVRQEVSRQTGVLSQLSFETYMVDLSNLGDNFSSRWRDARERSMVELLNPEGGDQDPAIANRFTAEFHMRLALPFLSMTFVLIACVFVLTGTFDRRGIAKKIIYAASTVILMEALMLSAVNNAAKQPWMVIFLYLIAFAPVPFLLYRLSGHKKSSMQHTLQQTMEQA
jgi:lipopolysaccharide export system permease protein